MSHSQNKKKPPSSKLKQLEEGSLFINNASKDKRYFWIILKVQGDRCWGTTVGIGCPDPSEKDWNHRIYDMMQDIEPENIVRIH